MLCRRGNVAAFTRWVELGLVDPLHFGVVGHTSGVDLNVADVARVFEGGEFDVGAHIVVTDEVRVDAESVSVDVEAVKLVPASKSLAVVSPTLDAASVRLEAA